MRKFYEKAASSFWNSCAVPSKNSSTRSRLHPVGAVGSAARVGGRVDAARDRMDQRQVLERDLLRVRRRTFAARRAVHGRRAAGPARRAVRVRLDRVAVRVEAWISGSGMARRFVAPLQRQLARELGRRADRCHGDVGAPPRGGSGRRARSRRSTADSPSRTRPVPAWALVAVAGHAVGRCRLTASDSTPRQPGSLSSLVRDEARADRARR